MADTTPPEIRRLVDDTVQLLKRQAGVLAPRRRPLSNDEVERRLRLIRRQAESQRGR